jgi:Putative auto-transporter adhesin, head GIN domain
MKISTSLSLALVIILAGCGYISTSDKVKGSGIVKTEKRSLTPFDSLEVVCHGSIQVRNQEQEGLEISGDDNILPLIITEVKNGTLYIRSSKEYDPQDKLEITVSVPDLKRFIFSGAGEANLSNVKNDRMEIALNGAGSLTASGDTKDADITLSGAGSVDAKNLHADNAKVNSSGVGSVEIYVTGQLDAKTSGIGEISYYGNPKIVNKEAKGLGGINSRQ